MKLFKHVKRMPLVQGAGFLIVFMVTIVLSFSTGCSAKSGNGSAPAPEPTEPAFILTSTAFADGEAIPDRYTCAGVNTSPELSWRGEPEDTRYYILLMEDLDSAQIEAHWILYNIPEDVRELHDGISHNGILDTGAIQGRNYLGKLGYYGPCHDDGTLHRYRLTLYAVDIYLDANAANRTEILQSIEGHVLAKADLTGTYKP